FRTSSTTRLPEFMSWRGSIGRCSSPTSPSSSSSPSTACTATTSSALISSTRRRRPPNRRSASNTCLASPFNCPIEYHPRTNRHGFKAGALQEGLETATGEFVAIFDADFIPPPDFLTRTIHYFSDPTLRGAQTGRSFLN